MQLEGRPVGKARAVGIAACGEVRPIVDEEEIKRMIIARGEEMLQAQCGK